MRKRKHSFILGIMLLVLALGIGYAYLNTTLNISGTTDVDSNTWDVYWDNVQVTTGSVTAATPTIDTSKTTVSFSAHLSKPGDFYEFTVDAVNDGSIDAMISEIAQTLNGGSISNIPSYVDYSLTYADGISVSDHQILHQQSTETYKVRVEYKKNINPQDLPSVATTMNFGVGIVYLQADSTGVETPHPNSFATDDWGVIQNAIQEGATSAYHVGDTREIEMSGSFGTQTIRIANMSTPEECARENFSQSACGFVLEFVDTIAQRQMNSTDTTVGGWGSSSGRTYVNNTVYNALPQDLKNLVIDTRVVSSYDPENASDYFVTTDKLYLVSMREQVYNTSCNSNKYGVCLTYNQTRVLDFYANGGSRDKYKHGTSDPDFYWMRDIVHARYELGFMAKINELEVPDMNATSIHGMSPLFRIG